ncbi:MAG TPA: 30S ribosomal protein S20 [Candidatus Paceibacterota bacterium]|nr:30S ribosomal protein S20 [Candidatus Paceibacterota bacterium]
MANTSSAKKAKRQAERKRVFNARRKKAMHDTTKVLSKAVAAGAAASMKELMPAFQKALDKAAKAGTISKNHAARMKSRMAKRLAPKK